MRRPALSGKLFKSKPNAIGLPREAGMHSCIAPLKHAQVEVQAQRNRPAQRSRQAQLHCIAEACTSVQDADEAPRLSGKLVRFRLNTTGLSREAGMHSCIASHRPFLHNCAGDRGSAAPLGEAVQVQAQCDGPVLAALGAAPVRAVWQHLGVLQHWGQQQSCT